MHNKFVIEKWIKRAHISVNEENLLNLGLKRNIN